MWSAEREGARHERQLDAESSARSELASTLAQSEHAAQEMGSLLTQQRTVRHSHHAHPFCRTRQVPVVHPASRGCARAFMHWQNLHIRMQRPLLYP